MFTAVVTRPSDDIAQKIGVKLVISPLQKNVETEEAYDLVKDDLNHFNLVRIILDLALVTSLNFLL